MRSLKTDKTATTVINIHRKLQRTCIDSYKSKYKQKAMFRGHYTAYYSTIPKYRSIVI
jgi:hypothetical protein